MICSKEGPHVYVNNGADSNLFGLEPNFGCCTANLHQGWPKFACHLWMKTAAGGLAVIAYAPCVIETTIEGKPVKVAVETDYPFGEKIAISVTVPEPMDDRATTALQPADILVVDDTPSNLDLLMAMFQARGYRVRVATGGQRALLVARHAPPDLVMLDVRMPDLDGYEVCRRLKADPATQAVPIIFISGYADVPMSVRAMKGGAVEFLTKPIHHQALLDAIRAAIG